MGCVNLRESDDHRTVEAVLEQSEEVENIDVEFIQQLLEDSDFSRCKHEDSGIHQLVSAAEALLAEKEHNDDNLPISFIVAKRIDAQLSLQLSPDKLTATAVIRSAYGGRSVGPNQLKQALEEANIRKGLKSKEIKALLTEAHHATPGTTTQKEIACGKNPKHGKNGQWISDVKTLRQQLSKPQQREDGTVDMLDFGEIVTVKEGELLMHLEPPTPGRSGFTVTGEAIPPKPGKEVPFSPAEGVTLSESKDQILATRQGIPVEQPRGMRVDQIYTASKVDLSTGHVTFDGSVIIQGDVSDSMKITATGDITIGGSVYYATIEAGGDIVVKNGVIGRQPENNKQFNVDELNCQLTATGHIQVGFAQYTRLQAAKDINVEKQLLHCFTQAKGLLDIGRGPKDRNSKLIGGITKACKGVQCANYGTEAFIPTEIRMCCNYQELIDLEQQIGKKLPENKQLLQEMLLLLPTYKDQPKTPDNIKKTRQLIQAIQQTKKLVATLQNKVRKLRLVRDKQLSGAKMLIRGKVFPNVKVHIADYPLKITEEHSGGGVCFRKGEMVYDTELK
ncbi:MAG: DUF342 domain-containing protein [Neptuniibacter sp.]